MNLALNPNLKNIKESPTLALNAKAQALQKIYPDFINLTVGEPDFLPPQHVCDAVIEAVRSGKHSKYTPVGGTIELKQTVANYFTDMRKVPTSASEVMASTGCKQAIYNALLATLSPGQEVVIPSPYWMAYSEVVTLLGAVPVIIDTADSGGKLTAQALEKKLNTRTAWLILNSPSNPTGLVYFADEMRALGEVLRSWPLVRILSDEIYAFLNFQGGMSPCFLQINPHLTHRTVIVDGVSKFLAVTGWRLGYCRASQDLIVEMTKIQSQTTSNPCSLSQIAAIAGLKSSNFDFVKKYTETLWRRYQSLQKELLEAEISYYEPQGAFYLFLDLREHLQKKGINDLDFSEKLIEEKKLCVVPGSAFGSSGFLRVCLTQSDVVLKEAIHRIKSTLK